MVMVFVAHVAGQRLISDAGVEFTHELGERFRESVDAICKASHDMGALYSMRTGKPEPDEPPVSAKVDHWILNNYDEINVYEKIKHIMTEKEGFNGN